MRKLMLLALVLIAIVGCVTNYELIPPSYDGNDKTTITVWRKYNFVGAGVAYYLQVNNNIVCELWGSDKTTFTIKPGIHHLSVLNGSGMIESKRSYIFKPSANYLITIQSGFRSSPLIIKEK